MGNMIDKPKIYVIYLQQYSLHVKTYLARALRIRHQLDKKEYESVICKDTYK